MARFTIEGDVSLLCSALELAADRYDECARECDACGQPSLGETFKRQAAQARVLLTSAYDVRDA